MSKKINNGEHNVPKEVSRAVNYTFFRLGVIDLLSSKYIVTAVTADNLGNFTSRFILSEGDTEDAIREGIFITDGNDTVCAYISECEDKQGCANFYVTSYDNKTSGYAVVFEKDNPEAKSSDIFRAVDIALKEEKRYKGKPVKGSDIMQKAKYTIIQSENSFVMCLGVYNDFAKAVGMAFMFTEELQNDVGAILNITALERTEGDTGWFFAYEYGEPDKKTVGTIYVLETEETD